MLNHLLENHNDLRLKVRVRSMNSENGKIIETTKDYQIVPKQCMQFGDSLVVDDNDNVSI